MPAAPSPRATTTSSCTAKTNLLFCRSNINVILVSCLFLATWGCSRPSETTPVANESNEADAIESDQETAPTAELAASFVQEVPKSLVQFTMVLVPGDDSKGIAPFYLGKHEVSWDEFAYWALCEGISDKKAILLREEELRPSTPHDTDKLFRGWGRANQPALSMSRMSAEIYCQWLSEETGKKYRLPTVAEWEYALEKGGNSLDGQLSPEELAKIAWHEENTFDDEVSFDSRAKPLGSLQPNELGIHDMLGNVAEWVTDTGERYVLRGGHFRTPAAELNGKHEEIEDQAEWNKNYPQTPKSKWGYVDADFTGFRLLCEP